MSNPDLRLNIHIAEESCTLSLDSSGESLHLRGYRTATVDAPINKVLAAALIKMSGWQFDCDLIDPFCGSGTHFGGSRPHGAQHLPRCVPPQVWI